MEANIELTVVRYEVYPKDEPSSFCVGFSIRHTQNNNTIYRDCLMPLSEYADVPTDGVLDAAWRTLKPSVEAWYDTVKDKPVVIGSVFVPLPGA